MRTRLLLFVLFFFFCLNALSFAQTAAVGDLNGDGKPDVVVGNRSSNTITVFINDGAGNLNAVRFLPTAHTMQSVLLADFNQDGHLDILVNELSAPPLELFSGDGTGNFSAGVQLSIGIQTPSTDPVVADFNGDGFQDIAFASGEAIAILFGDGHGGFLPPRLFTIGLEGATFGHLYVTDANLDGKPDLLAVGGNIRGGGAAVCYIALNNLPAGFITGKLENGQNCTLSPDLNGDSIPDYPSQFITFFGDGQGGSLYTQLRINSIKLADGIPVDFDHNGTTDFVQAEGLAPGIRYYPGNGHGGFGDPITISNSVFNPIAIADLNADGFPDLVLQDPLNPANISVFLNPGTTPVSIATASQTQISASATTASTAAPVTLIANVSSLNAGSPNGVGTVTFTEGSTTLGTATVNIYGNAALDFTFTAGLHNVNAAFAGVLDPSTNTLFAPSASLSPVAVAVNPGAPPAAVPNIALATSVTPARQLNPVVFTVNVTPSASSTSSPGGSVVFKADGDVLGSSPLLGTTARLPVDALSQVVFPTAGIHNITATYGGDASFPPATSATLVEDVRSLTAARIASSVHVTAGLFPGPSQTFVLNATVVGVSNPPSKLIYRVNGAFLALAQQNSPNPVLFTPQFQGTYTISAEYPGDAVLAPSTATTIVVVGNPNGDFSLDASPASATVKAGQSATFTITISPVNGMNSPVTFACSGLPAASSCTFSPASLTPNGAPVSTTLTLNTTAASSLGVSIAGMRPWTFTSWSLGLVFGLLIVGTGARGKNTRRCSAVFCVIALALLMVSCGGGNGTPTNTSTGTPPGNFSITVTATSGASHSAALNITVAQ